MGMFSLCVKDNAAGSPPSRSTETRPWGRPSDAELERLRRQVAEPEKDNAFLKKPVPRTLEVT
jgi:hypothetical protein